LRGHGESYSDVILRLVEIEATFHAVGYRGYEAGANTANELSAATCLNRWAFRAVGPQNPAAFAPLDHLTWAPMAEIGGLERRLGARGKASTDADERKQRAKTANRLTVIGHRSLQLIARRYGEYATNLTKIK
jgi:hypothetical protein